MNDGFNDNLNRMTPGDEHRPGDDAMAPPDGGPELESLLREWHARNAVRAAAGRERLMASLRAGEASVAGASAPTVVTGPASRPEAPRLNLPSLMEEIEGETRSPRPTQSPRTQRTPGVLRRICMHRYSPLAAACLALASVMTYFVHQSLTNRQQGGSGVSAGEGVRGAIVHPVDTAENLAIIQKACRDGYVMAPDGGRLDAIDGFGNVLGPCILKHTDVDVQVSGFLSRVNVKQVYLNPHSEKVETVYTFPMSERAAVDRMTMTIGNRVIEGQVKERAEAQRVYQEARAQGRIASLLEQERPNIFTQSIANIEPEAQITIEISYVEVLAPRDGEYSFSFPTTIAPRYIPGESRTWEAPPRPRPAAPEWPELAPRRGIVLLGPAQVTEMQAGDTSRGTLTAEVLRRELSRAAAVRPAPSVGGKVWYNFSVRYEDGSKETGTLYTNGSGVVNNRAFFSLELAQIGRRRPPVEPMVEDGRGAAPPAGVDAAPGGEPGDNFASPTTQVPDANRITPMPARPEQRAGHAISITVTIDTGGPGVSDVKSALHDVQVSAEGEAANPANAAGDGPAGGSRKVVRLRNVSEIPNRDFSLSWKVAGGLDVPVALTHTGTKEQGNFFFVSILPPARADDAVAVPREIMFVLDRSGSMRGFKMEQAKALIDATLATLRPRDTFNVLAFSNSFETLWSSPRRATPENLAEARAFYGRNEGSGGTEMLKVISTALAPSTGSPPPPPPRALSPEELSNLPADGRDVIVDVPGGRLSELDDLGNQRLPNRAIRMTSGVPDVKVRIRSRLLAIKAPSIRLVGAWVTENGDRILSVTQSDAGGGEEDGAPAFVKPIRLVAFITDGEIGNDMQVLDAIRRHRGDARVFSFAVGNSPNRYLLDGMARLGRGDADYVPLNADPRQIIQRFTDRVNTPVLTDIQARFSPNIQPSDVLTALSGGGGSAERVSDFEYIPDLYDQKPVIIVGRYTTPGAGTLTLSGNAAGGPWSKTINLTLPAREPRNSTIATLWARTQVESIIDANLTSAQRGTIGVEEKNRIVSLGTDFNLVTQFTSFVAVDRLRVTFGGQSRLVQIPIEFPQGDEWSGYFGGGVRSNRALRQLDRGGDGEAADETTNLGSAANLEDRLAVHLGNGRAVGGDLQPVTGDSAVGFDPTVAVSYDAVPQMNLQAMLQPSQEASAGGVGGNDLSIVPPVMRAEEASRPTVLRLQVSDGHPVATDPVRALSTTTAGLPVIVPATPASAAVDSRSKGVSEAAGRGARRETPGAPVNRTREAGGGAVSRESLKKAETATSADKAGAPAPSKAPGEVPPPAPADEAARQPARDAQDQRPTNERKDATQKEKQNGVDRAEIRENRSDSNRAPGAGPATAPTGKPADPAKPAEPAGPAGKAPASGSVPAQATPPAPSAAPGSSSSAESPAQPAAPVAAEPAAPSLAEQLRSLLESTQLAAKPEDRLGEVTLADAADQKLIDAYRAEVEAAARRLAAFKSAQDQASGVDKVVDASVSPAEADQAQPAADAPVRTSHRTGPAASTEPAPALPPVLRPVRREEIAMHIGSLAKRGKLDEATRWVAPFYELFQDYEVAERMRDVVRDESITDDARAFVLVELGDRAASQLAAFVRESKIRRRVQSELVPFALASGYPDSLEQAFDGPFPETGIAVGGGLLVSLIVEAVNDDTLKALREAGLRVEMSDKDTRAVVGVTPLGRIDDVALVPGVHRVEMTRE